ncbi:MAG: exonuclease SbcCD subunit D [Clostridia bacterium]|nr:exonuclease SbcCD subunit D [Clostridia bacterium]
MRILHLADLHIGRKMGAFDLLPDQKLILDQIVEAARGGVDCVVIAGDLYNRSQPSDEAVRTAGDFLTRLSKTGKPVFVIPGTHDSAEYLAYCRSLLASSGVYMAGPYEGVLERHRLRDEFGPVDIVLMPYLRPARVRRFLPGASVGSLTDAAAAVLSGIEADKSARCVLVAHQFVSGARVCDSEERVIGGLEEISLGLFDGFDYTALGHLHSPQTLPGGKARYAGSPIMYSLSEENQRKTLTVAELREKGNLRIEEIPLRQARRVRTVRGAFRELLELPPSGDLVRLELTDEIPPMDPQGALASVFPNILQLVNLRRQPREARQAPVRELRRQTPLEHFIDFYAQQHGEPPDEARVRAIRELLAKEGEGE